MLPSDKVARDACTENTRESFKVRQTTCVHGCNCANAEPFLSHLPSTLVLRLREDESKPEDIFANPSAQRPSAYAFQQPVPGPIARLSHPISETAAGDPFYGTYFLSCPAAHQS